MFRKQVRKTRGSRPQTRNQGSLSFEALEPRRLLATYYGGGGTIVDNNTTNFTLSVPDSLSIGDIDVQVDIQHTSDQDLDVFLVGPDGTRVELFTDVGGGGDDFSGTVLDDESATSITAGAAPFSGSFSPEGSLAAFDGKDSQGTWTLEITDDKRRKTGTLNSWSIDVTPSGPVLPTLSIDDVSMIEGDSGTTAFEFTVTRSGDVTGASSVDFATANGSADAGTDYVSASGSLNFLDNETTKTITVTVNGDTDIEFDESFSVDLSNPTDATISDAEGIGAIADDDSTPTISFPDFSDSSGLNLIGDATIANGNILRLTPAAEGMNGAAWYGAEKQYVSFGWETTFDFNFNDFDPIDGSSDGFVFAVQNHDANFLSGGGGTLGYNGLQNSLAIEFDTFQNSEVNDPSHSHISVHTNGTGPNGWDEALSLGSYNTPTDMSDESTHSVKISYAPGTLSVFFDDLNTPVLTVSVDLSILDLDNGRAWVGFTAATGGGFQNHDILNWDYRVLADISTPVAIEDASVIEGDAGSTNMVFTVNRTGDTSGTTTVDWSTVDGSASAGSDYTAASGQIVFNAGELQKSISVLVNGDVDVEAHETLLVSLSGAVGGIVADNSGTGTILTDDVSISIDDASATENDTDLKFFDAFVSGGNGISVRGGMDFGPDGNLYVSGWGKDNVLRFDSTTGAFIDEFVASGSGGLETANGTTFHNGDLYVVSVLTNAVLRYDGTTGIFIDEFVAENSGGLELPRNLLFGSNNDVFVTSLGEDDAVLRYDATSGAFLGEFIASGDNGLDDPIAIILGPDGNYYVSSLATNSIFRYDPSGNFIDVFVAPGAGGLNGPTSMFFDSGLLYVGSYYSDSVLTYDQNNGQFVEAAIPAGSGGLDGVGDMKFDSDGNLLVVSFQSNEILRYGAESTAVFTVNLSSPNSQVVTVEYTTADNTAVAWSDYALTNGTVTFDPGVTTRTILVPTIDDANQESTESFFVNLANALGGGIVDGQGEATVLDDDAPTGPTTLFQDSFENGQWNGLWAEDSQNDWLTSTQRSTDGNHSAEVDGNASDATLTVANPIDLSTYGSAELTFDWLIEGGFDSGEYLALDFFNGSSWIEVLRLDGNVDNENVWHNETVQLDSQYMNNDFQFRYRSKVNRSNEDANVDNVKLVGNSNALKAEVIGSGSDVVELDLRQALSLAPWAEALWQSHENPNGLNYELRIADLPGNLLGLTNGNVITIDADAAGMGWFVDATLWDSSEFETKTRIGNQYDLLTVLAHELGHLYGHDHEQAGVMDATLDVNTRLIPETTVDHTIPMQVDLAFAQWTPDLMPGRFVFSTSPLNQIQLGSAETKRGQLALPSTEQRYFQSEMGQRIDRESASVGMSDPLDAKSERNDWTDLDLTDKLFGDFDELINEFELDLG